MTKRQKRPRRGICAYCGHEDELTTDHVIPQCLFDTNVPGDVPKVLACLHCNNAEKSVDDTYLRDMLISDPKTAKNVVAQNIRRGSFARSVGYRKSQYMRDASSTRLRRSPVGSELYIYEPLLPRNRLRGIFIRLVHGLMYAYEGHMLPASTNFDVLRAVDPEVALAEAERWAADTSGMVHTVSVGDGSVFWCVYYHSHEQQEKSMWWLRFYSGAVYWIGTDLSNLSLGEF